MIPALGLDLSTAATGVCLPDGTCRTIRPQTGPSDPARRLHEIIDRLGARLHAARPIVAVIEGYFVNPRNMKTSLRLAELGGAVRLDLHTRAIPYLEIQPSALKAFATGSGNASKDDMIAAARAHGAEVANDNEADAWWLWMAAQQRYEPHHDRPLLTEGLRALDWPTLRRNVA